MKNSLTCSVHVVSVRLHTFCRRCCQQNPFSSHMSDCLLYTLYTLLVVSLYKVSGRSLSLSNHLTTSSRILFLRRNLYIFIYLLCWLCLQFVTCCQVSILLVNALLLQSNQISNCCLIKKLLLVSIREQIMNFYQVEHFHHSHTRSFYNKET